jgi:transcriptional regulator with XRE-family HTH domain
MSTLLIKEIIPQIGKILRVYREKRGQNLSDVAEKAGISVSMLSQIERGKVSPSIETLLRVCDSLSFDVIDIFRRLSQKKNVIILHQGGRLKAGGHGIVYEQLIASPESNFPAEMFLLEVAPGEKAGLSGGIHEGIEMGYVLKGTAMLTVGVDEYALAAGDSISFYSHVPHTLTNKGSEPFSAVWNAIPPHKDYLELDQTNGTFMDSGDSGNEA